MKVHVLQHVAFEGLGSIAHWLDSQHATISYTHFYHPLDNDNALPNPSDFDLIIVLGGPMSVNDESAHPWLVAEKTFIQTTIADNVPLLGICLGAQLIAASQGAAVYAGKQKEIGWFPIQGGQTSTRISNSKPIENRFQFPSDITVFHWHGETFDLPENASLLASSSACPHQAFQLGQHVIGLQFHLETTLETAKLITTHCADELKEHAGETYVQSAETILNSSDTTYTAVNALMADILGYLTRNKR